MPKCLRRRELRILRQFLHSMFRVLPVRAAALSSLLKSRASRQLENLALRHQIGVLQRSAKKRPRLTAADRMAKESPEPRPVQPPKMGQSWRLRKPADCTIVTYPAESTGFPAVLRLPTARAHSPAGSDGISDRHRRPLVSAGRARRRTSSSARYQSSSGEPCWQPRSHQ